MTLGPLSHFYLQKPIGDKPMNRPKPLYEVIASLWNQINNLTLKGSSEQKEDFLGQAKNRLAQIVDDFMPSGSGIDNGTKFIQDESHATKLVFNTEYHHMNENGFYDGWTSHKVKIIPTFYGIDVRVTGRDRNQIKDYLGDTFDYALGQMIVWDTEKNRYAIATDPPCKHERGLTDNIHCRFCGIVMPQKERRLEINI